jgi:putative ABC transport system permease protein
MALMPILSTLRRHKTAATLIVLEIALTSAIVCNALHLIGTRIERLQHDTGLPEQELVVVTARAVGNVTNPDEITAQDLAALRALPGVQAVALVNQVVYGRNNSTTSLASDPDRRQTLMAASHYSGGMGTLQAMGLKLIEGRDFRPEEIVSAYAAEQSGVTAIPQVIVNRGVAEKLAPGGSALGKTFYAYGSVPHAVIGVVEHLPHTYPGSQGPSTGLAVLYPFQGTFRGGAYLLRTAPANREATLRAARAALERIDASRIIGSGDTVASMRRAYYAQDRAMAWLMGGVIVALMVVTAFGIVGLASFWVQQRTRMIGTRRALGATAGQIRGYFQLENFLLSSAGIAIGMAAAMGLSLWLMKLYAVPRLPWAFLPVGALALWALGQAAVLAPARRAAALPPVQALRS